MQPEELESVLKQNTFYYGYYLIFVSPADVEPPELDSLLDAIDTGLGLRDDATELQLADAVNWH